MAGGDPETSFGNRSNPSDQGAWTSPSLRRYGSFRRLCTRECRLCTWECRLCTWEFRLCMWGRRLCMWERRLCMWECRRCTWECRVCTWECRVCTWECRLCMWECPVCMWERRVCMWERRVCNCAKVCHASYAVCAHGLAHCDARQVNELIPQTTGRVQDATGIAGSGGLNRTAKSIALAEHQVRLRAQSDWHQSAPLFTSPS